MSVRDRIAQQEAQRQQDESTSTVSSPQPQAPESNSEMLSALSSMGLQQLEMSKTVAELVSGQNEMVQAVKALSTSLGQGTSCSAQLSTVQKNTNEIAQTLELLIDTLKSSEAVKLPDGSRIKKSDLDSYQLVTALQNEMKAVVAGTEKLAAEVHKKAQIAVDQSKLADAIVPLIEEGLVQRFETSQKAREARVEALGEAKVSDVTVQLTEAYKAVQQYSNIVAKLGRGLTWSGVGSVALALIPFAIAGLALATLLGLGGEVLGVGPLLGWAWDSFWTAQLWWHKALIGGGIAAGLFGMYWLVRAMGRKLADTYKGW